MAKTKVYAVLIEKKTRQEGGFVPALFRKYIVTSRRVWASPAQLLEHYKNIPFRHARVAAYALSRRPLTVHLLELPSAETLQYLRRALGSWRATEGVRRDLLSFEETPFGVYVNNGLHLSDSPEEGRREARLWFGEWPKLPARVRELLDALGRFGVSRVGGSQLNGTAVPRTQGDYDVRLITEFDLATVQRKLEQAGLPFDKYIYDEKSGLYVPKFEINYDEYKIDLVVVPWDHYLARVTPTDAMHYLPQHVRDHIRRVKTHYKFNHSKQAYKQIKKRFQQVLRRALETGHLRVEELLQVR